MKQLRPAFLRFLMVCIVATIVTGTLGMGATGPFPDTETTHMAGHTAMDPGSDCPVAAKSNAHRQTGHGACALTICCFSEAPDLTALKPDFELMPARYVLSVEPRLTQSEPERAKKPPRHA